MTHLFDAERIRLLCACGLLRPITAIYFCRHCTKLRCANCVSHEMDMLYCPHCLENMPAPEARLKKNRCGNCFDCPSCGQSLSTRAGCIQTSDPEQPSKMIVRKLYYLACAGCRWTSRDVNIPDQTVATGGWSEQEPPNLARLQAVLEHYRAVAQRDKLEREKLRLASTKLKNSPLYLRDVTDRTSVSAGLASVRKSLSTMSTYAIKRETSLSSKLEPSQPTEDCEGLPEGIFTENIKLAQICSLPERLWVPSNQPELTSSLYPVRKHMLVKRSLRCRHCEHNLSKPEFNPSSIKFKIQLAAYYHVPEIRLVKEVALKENQESVIELSLCNPTPHAMTVALLPYVHMQQTVSEVPSSLPRLIEVPHEHSLPVPLCENVVLPQGTMVLNAKDDTAEYDESDSSSPRDDPTVVAWRKANKVGVRIYVTPSSEEKEVNFAFTLRYDYTNTIIAASAASGPMSLGPGSGPSSLTVGGGGVSGPNSLGVGGATSTESRTITLNTPVIVRVGKLSSDPTESHA